MAAVLVAVGAEVVKSILQDVLLEQRSTEVVIHAVVAEYVDLLSQIGGDDGRFPIRI